MHSRLGHRLADVLRSQGLGVACGLSTAGLLAIGSIVMAATADGASAGVAMDDATAFFRPPSPWHAWFYGLLPVLAVYAVNTTLCTWDQAVRAVRQRRADLPAWAPVLFHLAFVVALAAHGLGGFLASERGMVAVRADWSDLGDDRQARVTSIDVAANPDGSERQVLATVEVREPSGAVATEQVEWNRPLSRGLGSDLWLMARHASVPRGVRLSRGASTCEAAPDEPCALGDATVHVTSIRPAPHGEGTPLAWMRIDPPAGDGDDFFLWPGRERRLSDGSAVRLEALTEAPVLLLRARHAPGDPLALLSAVLLIAGVAAMGRRWV